MSSPWPKIEQAKRATLAPRGLTFSYEQCVSCRRWFPNERPIDDKPPTLCPWICGALKRPRARLVPASTVGPPLARPLAEIAADVDRIKRESGQ